MADTTTVVVDDEMIDPVTGEIIDQKELAERLLAQAKEQGVSLTGPGSLLSPTRSRHTRQGGGRPDARASAQEGESRRRRIVGCAAPAHAPDALVGWQGQGADVSEGIYVYAELLGQNVGCGTQSII